MIRVEIVSQLDQINAQQWNALVQDNNPFLRHEFLSALEHHGCVGEQFGWLPRHIAVYDAETLVAALPLYEKYNSYGEFVFDHAWAETYKQNGLAYFPKLVSSIPYTPASGQRLLVPAGREAELYPLLLDAVLQVAEAVNASSWHCLFAETKQQTWLESQDLIARHDCQFHWFNQQYANFDEFLSTFSSKKRKNVKQERRKVQESGVQLRVLDGHSATPQDWQDFAFFYQHTFESKWGIPTLNYGFFLEVAQQLPKQMVLVLADLNGECVAGSLMFRSDSRLFGRHWGCTHYIDGLHFEACYYQGIDYCIRHNLQVFEPGAQGEHKVARGFVPTLTRSSHWLADARFMAAARRQSQYEQQAVAHYMQEVREHSPYAKPLG
jgi:hypothetical protein